MQRPAAVGENLDNLTPIRGQAHAKRPADHLPRQPKKKASGWCFQDEFQKVPHPTQALQASSQFRGDLLSEAKSQLRVVVITRDCAHDALHFHTTERRLS